MTPPTTPKASARPAPASARPGAVAPSLDLSGALIRVLTRRARVAAADWVDARFRRIILEGEAFTGASWTPGRKVQIGMGEGFKSRTYTPIGVDAQGRSELLGFVQGEGPGAGWLRRAEPGLACDVLGPRPSLDLSRIRSSSVLFGDETSFGLALALSRSRGRPPVQFIFEADDVPAAQTLLAQLGLKDASGIARRPNDAHLADLEALLPWQARAGAAFVLTGKASSIQRLRAVLRRLDGPPVQVMTKAYWSPGKAGLD